MNARPKVIFEHVSKRYTLHQKRFDKMLELFFIKKNRKSFYALKDISFSVNEGETIGVIGINGSGKSTLSNILAQVIPPTTGEINVNGETSLIAISVGLNNNLTGMENIELKCLMLGLKKEEIQQITPMIIEFADIGDFINQPVKTYSSGMKSRLGFAISAHSNPDILIIDEALSVGDQTFYEKCIKKMNEFKKEGKTIFFISHSISQVSSFCDRTMWLHYGELVEFGETKEVINKYNEFIEYFRGLSKKERAIYKKEKLSFRQSDVSNITNSNSRRSQKVKKDKSGFFMFLELGLLLFIFISSAALLLFGDKLAKGIELINNAKLDKVESMELSKKENNKNTIDEQKAREPIEIINQIGYILNQNVPVFQTESLNNKLTTLNFSEQVHVEKKIANAMEISTNNVKGYVDQESIYLPPSPLEEQVFSLNSYLQGLPESFVRSYQYYMAFLNTEPEKIESKIRGKTGEITDELGNKFIVFGSLKYRLNSNNISDRLIISQLNPEQIDTEQLRNMASLISKDNNIIYILTRKNEFIFNLNDKTLTISAGVKPG